MSKPSFCMTLGRAWKNHIAPVWADWVFSSIRRFHLDTGEDIASNTINPGRTYWRNTQKKPGRWPSSSGRCLL